MKNSIKVIENMIKELETKQELYTIESNYSEIQDKIDLLYEVIDRIKKEN